MDNIVKKVEEIIKRDSLSYQEQAVDHYDFWGEHIKYVYNEAIALAEKYKADSEIVRLGALLHDIALVRKVGDRADHHTNGRIIAEEILTELKYPEDKKEKVLGCVEHHRSSKNAMNLEELCVADADILAHFDNIPMLFHSMFTRKGVSLKDSRDYMRETFKKDFQDLSEHTKKEFKGRYKEICKTVLGDEYE